MAARQRKVYHVSFDEKEEGWVLKAEGGRRVGGPYMPPSPRRWRTRSKE